MTTPASTLWFARHELRLAWRDWRNMITAGGRRSMLRTSIVFVGAALVLHVPAYILLKALGAGGEVTGTALVVTTVLLILFTSLLVSQAMETVTRSLYTRGDLDLVLSSPVQLTRLFAVRLLINTVPIGLLGLLLAMPLVNSLVMIDGAKWFGAYGVAGSLGVGAAALAVLLTIGLFKLFGPKRTRLIAQLVAAIIGAGFAIGVQVIAIVFYGAMGSTTEVLSDGIVGILPSDEAVFFMPARAVLGDHSDLITVMVSAVVFVALMVILVAPRLANASLAATNMIVTSRRKVARRRSLIAVSPVKALRRKEWALLRRDPWLVSQTMTQMLYLLPPALLLSQQAGGSLQARTIIVMVLVTVGGQLAGALAWLAISGEDAPELIATAPVESKLATRAKVEAVISTVGLVLAPLLIAFAFVSTWHALVAAIGALVAAFSTVRIQLWFRIQADRSHFRRRHTSSRIATFAEALTSFSWAVAVGMAAEGSWVAVVSGVVAVMVILGARTVSPRAAYA